MFLISIFLTLDLGVLGCLSRHFYTLAEGIMISVRRLQRSEKDVSDPIKNIYS